MQSLLSFVDIRFDKGSIPLCPSDKRVAEEVFSTDWIEQSQCVLDYTLRVAMHLALPVQNETADNTNISVGHFGFQDG